MSIKKINPTQRKSSWAWTPTVGTGLVLSAQAQTSQGSLSSLSAAVAVTQSLWEGKTGDPEVRLSPRGSESQIQTIDPFLEWHPTTTL